MFLSLHETKLFFWPFVSSLGIWEDPISCKLHQAPSSSFFLNINLNLKASRVSQTQKVSACLFGGAWFPEGVPLQPHRSKAALGHSHLSSSFWNPHGWLRTISGRAQDVFICQSYSQVSRASGGLPQAPRCPQTQPAQWHPASVLVSGRGHIVVNIIWTKCQHQREKQEYEPITPKLPCGHGVQVSQKQNKTEWQGVRVDSLLP